MRRVLLTAHKFFPQHGAGTEVLTLKTAQDLQRRGYEVLVVAANPPDLDARHPSVTNVSEYVYEGVPVHIVEESLRLSGYSFRHEYLHDGIAAHFDELLERFAPDVVHIYHSQNLSASIIDAIVARHIPCVFTATDFWFVCPVVQLKRPDGSLCRGPSMLAANCLTCYTPQLFPPSEQVEEAMHRKLPHLSEIVSKLPAPLSKAAVKALSTAYIVSKVPSAVQATVSRPAQLRDRLNKVGSIIVATKLMREIFVENGINPALIRHIPFGLDTAPLVPFQEKRKSQTLRIGFIGTIFEHKGVDVLVKAFKLLPADAMAKLTIFGDMNQFPEYSDQIKQLARGDVQSSQKIEFAGTFPNSRLGEVLQNLDVLVVPSRWYENTPLVIQSALCTKTPVICTDLGGMSELIKHDCNGLLFRLNDYEHLAAQLLRLITEPDLLPRLINNIAPERTIVQMVDEIESVYDMLHSQTEKPRLRAGAV